ncbi:MAG TPA: hypothetical protein VHB30_14900 [Solirubrobacteraceae bacterium]|nr:hypothetical protein [Solirubrobacteraceae bacterium]
MRAALALLTDGPADEREADLNRRLYQAIIAVQVEDARRGLEQLSVVVPEGRNPPAASDAQRAAREHKIPDFYWAYVDHLAPEPAAVARQFVVECKRLTASSKTWNYIAQYVDAGIRRFISEAHGYGKDASSGAMVGYLQNMEVDAAVTDVNAHASANGLPSLTVRVRSVSAPVELDHRLVRPFRDSPFLLMHFWTRVT